MKIKIDSERERVPKSNPRHCFQIGNTSMSNYQILSAMSRKQTYNKVVETFSVPQMIADGFTFGEPQSKDWGEGRSSKTVLIQSHKYGVFLYATVSSDNFTELVVRECADGYTSKDGKITVEAGAQKGYLV